MLLNCINVNYRNSKENTLNEVDMEAIDYLKKLGYSMEVIGVYYFKEMIVSIIDKILSFSSFEGEEMQKLFDSIDSPYSQFYFDLSRNKYDVGITTFNESIRQALSFEENENTGLKAYQIALQILQNRGVEINIVPFVRKLEQ